MFRDLIAALVVVVALCALIADASPTFEACLDAGFSRAHCSGFAKFIRP